MRIHSKCLQGPGAMKGEGEPPTVKFAIRDFHVRWGGGKKWFTSADIDRQQTNTAAIAVASRQS